MRLEGVRMKHYDAKGLVSYAHADIVDVASDRHRFDMQGVHDGLYRGDQGEFRYSATHASYTDYTSHMVADGLVRVRNKDLDVSSHEVVYDGQKHDLRVKSVIQGTLKHGNIVAKNIDYRLDTGAYQAGPVRWKGLLLAAMPEARELPQEVVGQDEQKPTVWEIQGDTVDFSGKTSQIATYTNAVATDGEIILIAPKVSHDDLPVRRHRVGIGRDLAGLAGESGPCPPCLPQTVGFCSSCPTTSCGSSSASGIATNDGPLPANRASRIGAGIEPIVDVLGNDVAVLQRPLNDRLDP